jgi:protein-S-isoprenylcysteine O-methyltransferase Ste14
LTLFRSVIGVLGYVALFAVLLFVPAGTLRWPAAWLLLAVLLVARGAGTIVLHREQAALLAERSRLPLQRGQVAVDRILLPAFMASFAGLVAFASWDVWHRQLLGAPPGWLRTLGLLAFGAGWIVVHAALRANAFAVTVVRHQAERGHAVATAGPYAIVRHPMYAAMVWLIPGLALWLGSTAAAVGTIVPIAILALRIVVEEKMLRRSLSDYTAYTRRVRWRLIPGLW